MTFLGFDQRSDHLLSTYARHADRLDSTIWGPHRCFDGFFLALYSVGDRKRGDGLLSQTLDLIDTNLSDEISGRGDKWHLADFAIHAVWRGRHVFGDAIRSDLLQQIDQTVRTYPYHTGGMSENHDLLQYAMRYLAGCEFNDTPLRDGRLGCEHRDEALSSIIEWAESYLSKGSAEWGADIYENVNLLSLLNLFDFAPHEQAREAARDVLDLMSREMALNAHAGATSGAARRGYGCYRISARLSPSRPLHWLWFNSGKDDFDVPWFVGGVLVAALSEYRPPSEAVGRARQAGPLVSSDWNTREYYQPDVKIHESFRVTTRLPGVQLSGMILPASPSRYTDFTWVASFDEDAIIMANHPRLQPPEHAGAEDFSMNLLDAYSADAYAEEFHLHPLWVPGNMPPGVPGDLRPGFWQGHGSAPACWIQERMLLNLFDISSNEPNQWFHLFLPTRRFDQIVQDGNWIFARCGRGMVRLWSSLPLEREREGTWADIEWRCMAPKGALFVEICSADEVSWERWLDSVKERDPSFEQMPPRVSANLNDGRRVYLDKRCLFPDDLLPPRRRSQVIAE